MEDYIERTMEQLNSGESKMIFKNISCIAIIGLTKSRRVAWQEEETTEVFAFANLSKAKAKPKKTFNFSSSRTIPILERTWIDIEPGAQFDQANPVAKRKNTLLRHGELPREEDGAIEFWRLKDDLQNKFESHA